MDSQGIRAEGNPGTIWSTLLSYRCGSQDPEGPCLGPHSRQGLQPGLEPRTPGSYPCGQRGSVECWGGAAPCLASRWTAKEWAPKILGGLCGRWGGLEPGVNCGACGPTGQGEACGPVCRLGLRGGRKDPAPGKPESLCSWPSCGLGPPSQPPLHAAVGSPLQQVSLGGRMSRHSRQPTSLMGFPGTGTG